MILCAALKQGERAQNHKDNHAANQKREQPVAFSGPWPSLLGFQL
jgi:hypothetical protein